MTTNKLGSKGQSIVLGMLFVLGVALVVLAPILLLLGSLELSEFILFFGFGLFLLLLNAGIGYVVMEGKKWKKEH